MCKVDFAFRTAYKQFPKIIKEMRSMKSMNLYAGENLQI